MRLGHVAVLVEDLDEMVSFYVEIVGLQLSEIGTGAGRSGAPRIAFLSWDPHAIHHQVALLELQPDPVARKNVNHIAFEVDSLNELRAIWARVHSDHRAGSLQPDTDRPVTAFMGDQWSIRFTDPERNGIEIYARTPWDTVAADKPYSRSPGQLFEPFDPDLDDDTLVAWGAEKLEALQIEYWPRGERPWPTSIERRTST